MKFFNATFLKKILSQYGDFKIFVDKEYISLIDNFDINGIQGTGVKADGRMVRFNYINIEHIKIGEDMLTKDMLNPEEKPEDEKTKKGSSKPADEPADAKEPEPKKEEGYVPGARVTVLSEWLGFRKGIVESSNNQFIYVRIFNPKTGSFNLFEVKNSEIIEETL